MEVSIFSIFAIIFTLFLCKVIIFSAFIAIRWNFRCIFVKNLAMILSMTGFGKAVTTIGDKKITAEIKSLNSKQLDLSVRLPQAYR